MTPQNSQFVIGNRSIAFNCFQLLAARFIRREQACKEVQSKKKKKKKVYVQEWILKGDVSE